MRSWFLVFPIVCWASSCGSPRTYKSSGYEANGSRLEAQQASARQDWETAAQLWADQFWLEKEGWQEAGLHTVAALRQLDDLEGAEEILDLGLERDSGNVIYQETLGEVLLDMGFRRAAESSFLAALRLDPERPSVLLNLARLRMDLGLEQSAMTALDSIIDQGAACCDTWYLRAQACREEGDVTGAYTGYKKSFEITDEQDYDRLLEAATLYLDQRSRIGVDKARARGLTMNWLNHLVSENPQCSQAYYILGVIHEDAGQSKQALRAYHRAAELDPTSVEYVLALAELCGQTDDCDRALELVSRAWELNPGSANRSRLKELRASCVIR